MMRRCLALPRRCLLLASSLGLLWATPGLLAQPAPAAAAPEQKKLTPEQKEQVRIAQIVEWATKTGASQEQVFKKIFDPIIDGNAKDQERNRRLAEECSQSSAAAKKNDETKAAEKFHTLDQLFTECSKENARVVASYRSGSMSELRAALTRLKQLDRRIEEVSGKNLERNWLIMDEMLASLGATAAAPAA